MTSIPVGEASASAPVFGWRAIWVVAFAAAFGLYLLEDTYTWIHILPSNAVVPVADWLTAFTKWLQEDFRWLTRGITAVMGVPLDIAFAFLSKPYSLEIGDSTTVFPRLSWVGIVIAVTMVGFAIGNRKAALTAGGCFLYMALFGQWDSAMATLSLVIICVPLGVIGGVLLGVWAHRSPRAADVIVKPALDLMQTVPTFAYLVPMLMLFGINPVSAMLATAIYATPPMVRVTMLALSRVPSEISDFAEMSGCSRRQKMWRVMLPSASQTLMVGVNQVIMMTLNMVIISSMIGAGGLGYDVLLALRALNVGTALEAGLAIVALAIALDRLSHAAANRRPAERVQGSFYQRHMYLCLGAAALVVTTGLSLFIPAFATVPEEWTITTAPLWKALIGWITVNWFDAIEAFRVALVINILNPVKGVLLDLPWVGVIGLLGLAGFRLGGIRLAALVVALGMFCVIVGLWEKTMMTLYLCGVGSIIAALIGIPLGVWGALSNRADKVVTVIVDTLQTLPSFVFLIPVVMLFRVGDVTALIAVVSFAVAPAIRYTTLGIRSVPPALIEAAKISGCTRQQILWRVQLPLALPEILLGLNQTILLALSMLIITALVGTRDLGQEVFIALAKADAGRGIVAGLTVAFIGIIADRLIGTWAQRTRERMGVR